MWKQEYVGFPLGFIRWMWDRHRVGFLVSNAFLVVGLLALIQVLVFEEA